MRLELSKIAKEFCLLKETTLKQVQQNNFVSNERSKDLEYFKKLDKDLNKANFEN